MRAPRYPETNVGNDIEMAAGVAFPDPYRWLEQEDEVVHQWQQEQNRISDAFVKAWPHYSVLEESVHHYFVDSVSALPRFVAGNWFRVHQPSKSPPHIVVSSAPYGDERAIVLFADGKATCAPLVNWISPSPDGRIVAAGVCSDGSERNQILLVDVQSGTQLPNAPLQVLMDAWTGGVCWLPDSSGFYFLALEGDPHNFSQTVFLHDLGSGEQSRANIPLPDPRSSDYTLVTLSRDGRYLTAHHGLQAPRPVAIKDLHEPESTWHPFITIASGTITGFIHRRRFIAVTDVNAPRGRLVAIPLDAENPSDSEQWIELLAESELVLRSVKAIGENFYVTGFVDTYSRVLILDQSGAVVGEPRLPGRGAIGEPIFSLMNSIPTGHPEEFYFVFSTLTESWGVYRHRYDNNAVETVRAPQVRIENAVVEDHWAVSADGVRVPYHTVRLASVDNALPSPALIYAYGAFNLALLPEYPAATAAFIAAGGIYVHGHIRGGGEFGLDWWRSGRMKQKQNCYRDLYAIAEDLISKGLTTSGQLAMTGRSNGGLMAGVAATQRPDLWRVLVARVPVTDLIGILRDPYGRFVLGGEYGDPNDADEIRRIAGFSPYHLVKGGIEYPAMFIEAGAMDPRCPPWHARKLAARLQAANHSAFPILLRIHDNAGHGLATPKAIQLSGYTQWLAFLMQELGMVPG
jgi:prolyl oligopeptidase